MIFAHFCSWLFSVVIKIAPGDGTSQRKSLERSLAGYFETQVYLDSVVEKLCNFGDSGKVRTISAL